MNTIANCLPRISVRASLAYAIVCVLAAVSAWALTPHPVAVLNAPRLSDSVPRRFGDWAELPSPFAQVSLSTGDAPNIDQPYDQTLMRTYVNKDGQVVMLALAWGAKQRQEVKVHRPDLCYVAQGHQIKKLTTVHLNYVHSPNGPVIGKRMITGSPRGGEAVTYWIRIGTTYSGDALETRMHILREGLAGRIPDGILVRASMAIRDVSDAEGSWPILDEFLQDLDKNVPAATRALLVK